MPHMRFITYFFLKYQVYPVFAVWHHGRSNELWPPPDTMEIIYLIFSPYMASTRFIHISLLELELDVVLRLFLTNWFFLRYQVNRVFHTLTSVDLIWPLTSTNTHRGQCFRLEIIHWVNTHNMRIFDSTRNFSAMHSHCINLRNKWNPPFLFFTMNISVSKRKVTASKSRHIGLAETLIGALYSTWGTPTCFKWDSNTFPILRCHAYKISAVWPLVTPSDIYLHQTLQGSTYIAGQPRAKYEIHQCFPSWDMVITRFSQFGLW